MGLPARRQAQRQQRRRRRGEQSTLSMRSVCDHHRAFVLASRSEGYTAHTGRCGARTMLVATLHHGTAAHSTPQRSRCRSEARRQAATRPRALLDFFRGGPAKSQQSSESKAQRAAVERLLTSIEGSERGLAGTAAQRAAVLDAAAALAELGSGSSTTEAAQISATWR